MAYKYRQFTPKFNFPKLQNGYFLKKTRIYSVEIVFSRIIDVSAVDLIQIRFKNFEHQFY